MAGAAQGGPEMVDEEIDLTISRSLEEHVVWRRRIQPLLAGLPANVADICSYGFTEMLNNVIDHSGSDVAKVAVRRSPARVELAISDAGVGIFRKLVDAFGFEDEQQAALELSKGKLTTDPKNHSGEGIFFSARAFDSFHLLSRGHSVSVVDGETWLIDRELFPAFAAEDKGTLVSMRICVTSPRTLESVFDRFSNREDDYRFSRTHVPVALVRVGDENLVSRSQAKRLLARLDRFDDVFLDFKGVGSIGQAFSDEVFRVFPGHHPGVKLHPVNTTPAVERMIRRALARGAEEPTGSE